MACGVMPIVASYSAPIEFVDDVVGYRIEVDMEEADVGWKKDCKDEMPQWGRVRVKDLADLMVNLYNNREILEEKGKKARARIEEEWTWKHAAQRFSNLVEEYF
jgi:glycosyltransferase involved in cell wall biosynthesis